MWWPAKGSPGRCTAGKARRLGDKTTGSKGAMFSNKLLQAHILENIILKMSLSVNLRLILK